MTLTVSRVQAAGHVGSGSRPLVAVSFQPFIGLTVDADIRNIDWKIL